jgi:hypothetical protein
MFESLASCFAFRCSAALNMTDHFDKMTSWKRTRAASEQSGGLAEGVGLLPTIHKALKINGRFRRYVLQDYCTGVPVGKGQFFVRNQLGFQNGYRG